MQFFKNFAFFFEKICIYQKKVVPLHREFPPRLCLQAHQGGIFCLNTFQYSHTYNDCLLNHFRGVDHLFQNGATLDDALCTYYFDKQLRVLIFQAIQSIEISLRTRMIQNISMSLGSFWFLDKENFLLFCRFALLHIDEALMKR